MTTEGLCEICGRWFSDLMPFDSADVCATCAGQVIGARDEAIEALRQATEAIDDAKKELVHAYDCLSIEPAPTTTEIVAEITKSTSTGQAIQQARLAAGLSQSALGARLGMKQSRIGDIERERFGLTITTLKRIAVALDVAPATLL